LVSSSLTFWPFNLRCAEISLNLSVRRSILHIIVLVLLIVPSVFWIRFLFDGNRCDWIQLFSGWSRHYFGFLCWSTFPSGHIISF
jgi:cell shape-determining protein MreD